VSVYEDISVKEWDRLLDLKYPPNAREVITKIHSYGRKSIVPQGDVMNCYSAIDQVNRAFIKNKVLFRLRVVQGGYPPYRSYPVGYLVQLVKKRF
jgi:hypothetical protein